MHMDSASSSTDPTPVAPDPAVDGSTKSVSARKIAANRANAQKSTGPRTDSGKARSSLNAISHGLSSQQVVLPDEDGDAYDKSIRELEADMQPRGALQRQLVHRIGSLLWRLNRIARIEQELWDRDDLERRRSFDMSRKFRQLFPTPFDEMRAGPAPEEHSDTQFIAGQFEQEKTSAVERLAVYEQRLDRQLNAALKQFQQMRKMQNEANDEEAASPCVEPMVQNEPKSAVAEPTNEQAAPQGATLRHNVEDETDKTKPPGSEVVSPTSDAASRTPTVLAPPGSRRAHP
jgi:hypothetical protein